MSFVAERVQINLTQIRWVIRRSIINHGPGPSQYLDQPLMLSSTMALGNRRHISALGEECIVWGKEGDQRDFTI